MKNARYARQIVMEQIGEAGQETLLSSRVAIIGLGALGTVIANSLARAGVGYLRLVDRDFVELSNVQRQLLYDEEDLRENLPKATAAARHLKKTNSEIRIEPIITEVNSSNIEDLLEDMDLVLDGTDNFTTRFLINDACIKKGLPWIYGSALGGYGMTMNIIPGETACFRCVISNIPTPGNHPTCSTVGVLNMVTGIIGYYQAAEAVKILIKSPSVSKKAVVIDLWSNFSEYVTIYREEKCPSCVQHNYEFLQGKINSDFINLCGSDSIQIMPNPPVKLDLQALAGKLGKIGEVTVNRFLLKFKKDEVEFTVFPDGRAIIKNIADERTAKSIYAEYLGL